MNGSSERRILLRSWGVFSCTDSSPGGKAGANAAGSGEKARVQGAGDEHGRMTNRSTARTRRRDAVPWVMKRDGIVHRHDLRDAGFSPADLRDAVRAGALRMIRRDWFVAPNADTASVAAVEAGGRVACVSAARARGWWIPDGVGTRLHVAVRPTGPRLSDAHVLHWSDPLVPVARGAAIVSCEDALQHVAGCLALTDALVIWESAVRTERLDPTVLQRMPWTSAAARALAFDVTGLSDSGLETILLRGLCHLSVALRPQAVIAGHRVDLLVGEWTVVQVDGYAYHSTAADRSRDLAQDHELTVRGYTVLRFTYAQIVHDWPHVARVIAQTVAASSGRPRTI